MKAFDPADPFPFYRWGSYSYQDAQAHAAQTDAFLGFQTALVEQKIKGQEAAHGQQNWQHLSVQAMQTPYVEIRSLLEILKPQKDDHLIDLGAAYGRMGFVLARHFPEVRFTGYELESLRVEESRRCFQGPRGLIEFKCVDLTAADFKLPLASIYFVFDYGSEKAVSQTLADLQMLAQKKPLKVVARGRLSRFLIHRDHPWLAQVNPPAHFDHFSIYQS